jgi:hypothetical protein
MKVMRIGIRVTLRLCRYFSFKKMHSVEEAPVEAGEESTAAGTLIWL